MSGKRTADTGAGKPRQFKQTKLSFFAPAPKSQPKALPNTTAEQPKETPSTDTEEAADPDLQPTVESRANQTTKTPNPTTTTKDKAITTSQPTTPAGIPPSPNQNPHIHIIDQFGDLFTAPPNTLLIHACNTIGSWGGGIALAFRHLYPAEFQIYHAHCARSTPDRLLGTALLIPPQKQPPQQHGKGKGNGGRGHYIGCLFTSRRYGKARDAPEAILRATGPAMRELMRLVVEEEERSGVRIAEVRMCRINSGLFAVPWGRSKRVLEEMVLDEGEVPACAEDGVVEVVAYERE